MQANNLFSALPVDLLVPLYKASILLKRVLLIAPYFLPRRRVGSMRPFRFATHLKACGWQPTVLALDAPGQQLTEKETRLLEGIDIFRITSPFDRTSRAESQLGMAPGRTHRSSKKKRQPLLDYLDRQMPIDTWLFLFLLKYRRFQQIIQRVQPHVIWSTADPWSSLVISERLVRQFGIPWVADFRDPWTLCRVRTEGQWALSKAIDRYFERRVLETAEVALFVAQQTEANYRACFADLDLRTATITNSYDPALYEDPIDLADYTSHAVSEGADLLVGFFGRFRALSPAAPLIDVLSRVRQRHGMMVDRIKVHSYGPLPPADAQAAEAQGVLHCFVRAEAVPLEKAPGTLRRFDVLLLSTDPRRDEIIPAKLFEYLPAGRPVLSLSRNPEVGDLLRITGTGIQAGAGRLDEIADLLAACLDAKREHQPLPIPFAPQPEAIRQFEARATTQRLAALFDSLC